MFRARISLELKFGFIWTAIADWANYQAWFYVNDVEQFSIVEDVQILICGKVNNWPIRISTGTFPLHVDLRIGFIFTTSDTKDKISVYVLNDVIISSIDVPILGRTIKRCVKNDIGVRVRCRCRCYDFTGESVEDFLTRTGATVPVNLGRWV